MINVSLESFCTQSWRNNNLLPYRTGQCFKIVRCVCQPEKCFMPLITEAFKCSHFRLVHTSTLLVSSTCKYKNVSSSVPSSSQKKSAFWLIFPCSSRGKKICCCLFLSKSRIIQTRYFNGEINCHFSQGFRCCLCFMRCHSWLHGHRSLIWSYFNSFLFWFFFFFLSSEVLHLSFTSIREVWRRQDKTTCSRQKFQCFGKQSCNLKCSS